MPPRAKGEGPKRKRMSQLAEPSPKTKKGIDPVLGSRKRQYEKKMAQKKAEMVSSDSEEEEEVSSPKKQKEERVPPSQERKKSGKSKPVSSKAESVEIKTISKPNDDTEEIDVKEFDRMLEWLNKLKSKLGGSPNFPRATPTFSKKITRREYVEQYSDYEFAYLQIVGFKAIHLNSAAIQELNNGQFFTRNPGTQLLERVGGMTMHGDRPGANAVVASAPLTLLRAFRVAQKSGDNGVKFFTTAFERDADPCLEGRLSHLLQYIEESPVFQGEAGTESQDGVPWADTCLDLRAKLDPQGLIGEYLRIFTNTKLAEYATKEGLDYETAKHKHQHGKLPKFESWCTRRLFKEYLLSQGLGKGGKKDEVSIGSLTLGQADGLIQHYVDLDSLSA